MSLYDESEGVISRAQFLIKDHASRMKAREENTYRVLDFLREELFSTTAILAICLCLSQRQTRNVLARLEREGLIVRDEARFMGRQAIHLWGIAFEGLVAGLTSEQISTASLRPHKVGSVKVPSLEHRLAIQECRAWHSGMFHSWLAENDLPCRHLPIRDSSRWKHYPDAVMRIDIDKGFVRVLSDVAIEVELTHKSQVRYAQIITAHYHNVENNRYRKIWYFCRTQEKADKLRELFWRLASDKKIYRWQDEERLSIEQSFNVFTFKSLDDLN